MKGKIKFTRSIKHDEQDKKLSSETTEGFVEGESLVCLVCICWAPEGWTGRQPFFEPLQHHHTRLNATSRAARNRASQFYWLSSLFHSR